jgi:hypothetical protein
MVGSIVVATHNEVIGALGFVLVVLAAFSFGG